MLKGSSSTFRQPPPPRPLSPPLPVPPLILSAPPPLYPISPLGSRDLFSALASSSIPGDVASVTFAVAPPSGHLVSAATIYARTKRLSGDYQYEIRVLVGGADITWCTLLCHGYRCFDRVCMSGQNATTQAREGRVVVGFRNPPALPIGASTTLRVELSVEYVPQSPSVPSSPPPNVWRVSDRPFSSKRRTYCGVRI